jgi:ribonuclease HI
MSILTVFVDASHCSQTRAAGWGAWARRDDWQRGALLGDGFKQDIPNSAVAELCGIANALTVLKQQGAFADIVLINVQCDCLRALSLMLTCIPWCTISKKAKTGSAIPLIRNSNIAVMEQQAIDAIRVATSGHRISVKHVKGHSGRAEGRSWVNDQCDRIAKRHMEQQRTERRAA